MPKYTLVHGGLFREGKHYPTGSTIELDKKEADLINADFLHLELSEVVAAETKAKADVEKVTKEIKEKNK